MKRMTREISSRLYIFLPYLSFNLGELLDTLEDTLRASKRETRCSKISDGLMTGSRVLLGPCATSLSAQRVLPTCRSTCLLPIDQIFKLPFLFFEF